MNADTLPYVPCNHRTHRTGAVDLLVIHTNEGPEGPSSAEDLAAYLHRPGVDPGYNYIVDENSAVCTAHDDECVWGAGGANAHGLHVCLTGYAAQSAAQWDDAASRSALVNAADITRQKARKFVVPMQHQTDTTTGKRGICGHADVSAHHPESMGHTDPGPNFPWTNFLAMVNDTAGPTAAQLAAYYALLEEMDVEHGMAVDVVLNPDDPLMGYTLDRWGGIHDFGGAKPVTAPAFKKGVDVYRRVVITDWAKGAGHVMDLDGGLFPFNGAAKISGAPYWSGGKVVAFAEL